MSEKRITGRGKCPYSKINLLKFVCSFVKRVPVDQKSYCLICLEHDDIALHLHQQLDTYRTQ